MALYSGSSPTKGGAMSATQEKGKVQDYVAGALRRVGVKVADLSDDQRARAETAPDQHSGLRGKSLAQFVLDGEGLSGQQKQASNDRIVREADEASKKRSEAGKKSAAKANGASGGARKSAYSDEVRA